MIPLAPRSEQAGLPTAGRHVLATFDEASVVVWQAHTDEVADAALARGRFGGPPWRMDRTTRMRLSLPSLLDRCDWGRRSGRERILAVRLARPVFDGLLRQAVHAEFEPSVYASRRAWHLATRYGAVSVAWHPDRDATGATLERETPRIGLRGAALRAFTEGDQVLAVHDWTDFVRSHCDGRGVDTPVPVLGAYPLDPSTADRLAGRTTGAA